VDHLMNRATISRATDLETQARKIRHFACEEQMNRLALDEAGYAATYRNIQAAE